MPKQSNLVIRDDFPLTVQIRGGEANGKTLSVDLMSARIAMAEVERKHKCTAAGWTATPEFLTDMAAAASKLLGIKASSTFAYQLWHLVSNAWAKMNEDISKASPPARRRIKTKRR